MKFAELDDRLRRLESALDQQIAPDVWLVARLDGRGFTKLTKRTFPLIAPFDDQFHRWMCATTEHLMTESGFHCLYGYTQSDEMSLLFHPADRIFQRQQRKYLSLLAGLASGYFSLQIGAVVSFDCRLSPLPTADLVVDYFRWRHEDAHRNALQAHCYWLLRRQGVSALKAANQIEGMSVVAKKALLAEHGISFDLLPSWQRRGIGFFWQTLPRPAVNPLTGATGTVRRRQLRQEVELPLREAYSAFLQSILASVHPPEAVAAT